MEFCTFCTILLFIPPPPYQQLGKRHLKITSSARPFVKVFVHVYASPIGQLASLTVFCSSEHLFCEENDLGSGRTLETNNIKISFLRLILLKTLRRWSSVKQQHQNTKQTFAQKTLHLLLTKNMFLRCWQIKGTVCRRFRVFSSNLPH